MAHDEHGTAPYGTGVPRTTWSPWRAVVTLGLVSLAAGTGAAFRQPRGPEGSATRTRESSDID